MIPVPVLRSPCTLLRSPLIVIINVDLHFVIQSILHWSERLEEFQSLTLNVNIHESGHIVDNRILKFPRVYLEIDIMISLCVRIVELHLNDCLYAISPPVG